MVKEYYLSEDRVILHGVFNTINEITSDINYTSINDMFYRFETIHELLARYEQKAKNRIRDDIMRQCVYRYGQYKKEIIDNRQFLTADVIRNVLAQHAFRSDMKKYGLCVCIEKAYLGIDFIMRSIDEHIQHIKGGISRFYKIKRYHGKFVMIENNRGLTFILDKDTNKGFIGYFMGSDIIPDRTKTVSDDEWWDFARARNRDGITYELI